MIFTIYCKTNKINYSNNLSKVKYLEIYPNIEYIKTISDIGLFAIIQYFIDKKSDNQ